MTDPAGKFSAKLQTPLVFLKWLLFAAIIGILCGAVGTAFHYAIAAATALRSAHSWLLFLLPAAGVVIVLLYRYCGMEQDRGTNFVLVAVRENQPLRLRTAPLVFVATVLTHLCGGSSGREGAALQLGGSISSRLGRGMRLDGHDSRVITMCGMSAAFAALFGTPLAAALFAMEVVSVGVMYYAALVPCLLSALIGTQVAAYCGISPTAYQVFGIPDLAPLSLLQVLGMGVLFALISILFCRIMHAAPKCYDKLPPSPLLRVLVGGCVIIMLTYLVHLWAPGTYDYNGAGGDLILRAMAGTARPEAFLLKMLFTAITLGAGFKGGEIVPAFCTGATFGCVVAPLLGLNPSFGAGLGLVSLFCGVTNCPMTSLLLALELFGSEGLPLFAVSCAVTYMLSGYHSLYSAQKIVYSKLKPQFIDKKAE